MDEARLNLRPQDAVLALVLSLHREEWTYQYLAAALSLSTSEAHAAAQRARLAGLIAMWPEMRPITANVVEFLVHGVRYAFPVHPGPMALGVPTARSAPALARIAAAGALPLVWPYPEGTARGESVEPLYPGAVSAARRDPRLYDALALVDAIRLGGARERQEARAALEGLLL